MLSRQQDRLAREKQHTSLTDFVNRDADGAAIEIGMNFLVYAKDSPRCLEQSRIEQLGNPYIIRSGFYPLL